MDQCLSDTILREQSFPWNRWRFQSDKLKVVGLLLPGPTCFSTVLTGQDQLFYLTGTSRAEKVGTGVFPSENQSCGSGDGTGFVIAVGYQLQAGVSVY